MGRRAHRRAGLGATTLISVDPTNRNTALASAMVEELARCGVRRAVVSPGSRSTPLALALWRQPAIDVEVILDERSAGFFALGTALASGVPAAVLCTSGSAAANLHPAVVEADEAGVPMIVLTADRPPELRGIGAGQAIDQLEALRLLGALVLRRSGPTRPTIPACCTSARSRAGRSRSPPAPRGPGPST